MKNEAKSAAGRLGRASGGGTTIRRVTLTPPAASLVRRHLVAVGSTYTPETVSAFVSEALIREMSDLL